MGKGRSFRGRTLVVAIVAALAGCGGGGGGGGSAETTFSFDTGTITLAESAAPTAVTVVLHTSLAALTADVSVDVADAGTGTGTSGSDYAVFATQTLTFAAGSLDGATQSVLIDPLDDLLVEGGNETMRLKLQNGLGGTPSGTTQFTATITDIHEAAVGFATTGLTTGNEAGGPKAVALELDCGAGVSLAVPVSVRVSDLHTGTASAGSDYSSFAARTVTFAAGSDDGDVMTVNLTVIDDGAVEGDETVVLGLSLPSGCQLGGIQQHTLTIHDDDLGGPSGFASSEGDNGTENPLSYDELIALGSETVGDGPNVGTLLRVTNTGGASMDLGAPRLFGTNLNDFAVEIESSSLASAPGSAPSAFASVDEVAPMVALARDGGPGLAMRLDAPAFERLKDQRAVTLHDFELPDIGPVSLELRRRPLPLTEDARLTINGQEVPGGIRTLVGDLQVWVGSVAGMPGSRVFLSTDGRSAQGFLVLPDEIDRLVHIVPDAPGTVRLLREPEVEALGFGPPPDFCAGERFGSSDRLLLEPESAGDVPPTAALSFVSCRLALETDFQFFQKFGSSGALTTYVTQLIAAISDQYATDVQATLVIASLGIHDNADDGWDTQEQVGVDVGDLLDEFRAKWGTGWAASADLAHFLSGDGLGGGIAYVNALCSPSFGFGVSANMTGGINWGTWTGQPAGFTWDFVVVAHELGHNFGSQHTHDYCPPLDHCYTNCEGTSCSRGTIMSYCHVSCGGMSNIDLYFHPVTANIMRTRVNASCLGDAALMSGDFVQYRVRFNPLTTTGAKSASLEFTHDAPNAINPFRVQLSGTAN